MSKKFLTLNIGAATVELAEYEAGAAGSLTLVNYGTAALAAPLDGGDAEMILSSALNEIVSSTGIRPGKVSVSVSGQLVFARLASVPEAGGSERFEQMVRLEIEQNVPFPIDEMICDSQTLGDNENGDKSVLVVAAKTDQVEELMRGVAAAGFTPELVDVAPLAVVNALYRARPEDGCVVVLDIGAKMTSLAIAEGDRIYTRSIPVAGNQITKEIAAALGCTLDEAEAAKLERGYVSMGGVTEDADEVTDNIAKVCRAVLTRLNAEITRSVNFYRSQQGGNAPTKLYLTGGTSLLPQTDEFFAETLGIEVETFDPFESVGVGPAVDAEALAADGVRLAATAGLAVRAAGGGHFAVDLLPRSILEARAEKAKIPFLVAGGAMILAALALVAVSVNSQVGVIEERRDRESVTLDGLRTRSAEVGRVQQELAGEQAKALEIGRLFARRTAALRRLGAVARALNGHPGMWIDRWGANGVTIRQWSDRIRGNADGGKTTAEAIANAIGGNDTNVIDRASVKISAMSEIGKGAQVKQFTVEFKGK